MMSFCDDRGFQFAERPRNLNYRIQFIYMGEDEFRLACCPQGGVNADTETAEAMRVGWRDLNEGHINRHLSGFKQVFHLAKKNRSVIGPPLVDGLANVAPDEHSVVAEVTFHLRCDVVCPANRQQVNDLHISHKWRPSDQRF